MGLIPTAPTIDINNLDDPAGTEQPQRGLSRAREDSAVSERVAPGMPATRSDQEPTSINDEARPRRHSQLRNARQHCLGNVGGIYHFLQWRIARDLFHGRAIAAGDEIRRHRGRRHAIYANFRTKHACERHRHGVKRGLASAICDVAAGSRER